MKITELARKPQLREVTIDDAETRELIGDSLTYWTWDRQPMSMVIRLTTINQSDAAAMMMTIKDLILDDTGRPVLTEDAMIPVPVLMKIINQVVTDLGKI
jgi:hypothetical protein